MTDHWSPFSGGIGRFIAEQSIAGLGAMGSRAKARLQDEEVVPDYTYAVIDRVILLAMNGKHGLVVASGGMVQRVFDRVDEFNRKHGVEIRVSRV